MENHNLENMQYKQALKRVKRIKKFYVHLLVYVLVNGFLLVGILQRSHGEFFALRNYSTAFFWGIGLLAHGLSVFMPGLVLGKDWEERKIKELMEKEKQNKWD